VLQRSPVHIGPGVAGVDEGDDTQHLLPVLGHGDHSIAAAQRPPAAESRADELLALARPGLWIRLGPVGAGPRNRRAEAVLDGHRESGELVDGLCDPVRAATGHRDVGEAIVDVEPALKRLPGALCGVHRPLQRRVGRAQLLGDGRLPRGHGLLLLVHPGVRQGARGLLGKQSDHDLLGVVGLGIGRHHEMAQHAGRAGQGIRPSPAHARQSHRPPRGPQRGKPRLHYRGVGHQGRFGQPCSIKVDGHRSAVAQRRDRGRRVAHDLDLIAGSRQGGRQLEQGA
jgi:hypothetical protein